jgi:hypothetical protein
MNGLRRLKVHFQKNDYIIIHDIIVSVIRTFFQRFRALKNPYNEIVLTKHVECLIIPLTTSIHLSISISNYQEHYPLCSNLNVPFSPNLQPTSSLEPHKKTT